MVAPACSDQEFISLFKQHGPSETSKRLKVGIRNVYSRRENLEKKLGCQITHEDVRSTRHNIQHPQRVILSVHNGHVLIGGDAHIWPGPPSLMMRAYTFLCKEFKPQAAVMNGDVLDLAAVSRHPPIGWEKHPTVQEEIEAAQEQLHEIEKATPRGCSLTWTLGNHDSRFETRLATVAPEYAKVAGIHLKDHFPQWRPCWSVWINDEIVVKHRYKGGVHAPHNNTVNSGKTIITNHLHSAKVTPYTDYNGTRYGVDAGCMADPDSFAFDYIEDNPKNWREALVLLTIKGGRLMQPELVMKWDADSVQFRGEIIRV